LSRPQRPSRPLASSPAPPAAPPPLLPREGDAEAERTAAVQGALAQRVTRDLGGIQGCLTAARQRLPARLRLEAEVGDFTEDAIMAVNLSRPVSETDLSHESQEAIGRAITQAAKAAADKETTAEGKANVEAAVRAVELRHFLGGPCDQSFCLVLSSNDLGEASNRARPLAGLGAACSSQLEEALTKAGQALARRRKERDGEDGPAVKRRRLSKKSRPEELFAPDPPVPLLVFWGEARWSRTQLLAEIARNDWGLCHAAPHDLPFTARHRSYAQLWISLTGLPADSNRSPVYAPRDAV